MALMEAFEPKEKTKPGSATQWLLEELSLLEREKHKGGAPVQVELQSGDVIDVTLLADNKISFEGQIVAQYNPDTEEIGPTKEQEFASLGQFTPSLPSVTEQFITGPKPLLEAAMTPLTMISGLVEPTEKLWAGAVTAPFRPDAVAPLPVEERMNLATGAPEFNFINQLLGSYDEWQAPKYVKGAAELSFPIWWVGGIGGVNKIKQLLKTVDKATAKQVAGKALTVSEQKTIQQALAIESEISQRIALKQAPKEIQTIFESKMPTIEEILAASYQPNIASAIGKKLIDSPGLAGQFFRRLLPMQAAKSQTDRAAIAWLEQQGIAPSLAKIEMQPLLAQDFPFKVNWKTGYVKNVVPKTPKHPSNFQAIAEFPERYILTAKQESWLGMADDILKAQLQRELAAGVDVRVLALKEGQRYIPRFVEEIAGMELNALKAIKTGFKGRPGLRPGSFKERYYEEVLDGVAQGVKYSTDLRAAIETRLAAGNKAISDKMFQKFMEPFGKTALDKIKPGIRETAWFTAKEYRGNTHLQKVINRAIRGERLPEGTLQAQERRFLEFGTRLREAGNNKTILNALLKDVKALESGLKQSWLVARSKAARALRIAGHKALGKEGTINHAGLQGRLFPVEMSNSVNEIISRQITSNQVLQQLAKVNDTARMGQTAIDTGFALIQGLMVLANSPSSWGKAFGMAMKTLKSPKYVARTLTSNRDWVNLIATHGGASFGSSEFTLAGRKGGWLLKIPFVGEHLFQRFGNAFEAYLDIARMNLVKAKVPHFTRKAGRELTRAELTDIVVTSDHMVGISNLQRLGVSKFDQLLLRNVMYAPRYYVAFVSFLGRSFQGGIGGEIARQSLVRFTVAIPAFMTAMAYATGQEHRVLPTKDKPIPAMFDPRTGEFMTLEIEGTHMGLGGVWIAAWRLLGSLVKTSIEDPMDFVSIDPHQQPILRYLYGRGSPVVSGAIDIATGENYLGEKLNTPMDYLHEVVDKTFPFWAAGFITDVPKAGWQKGAAEWWGLRAWMVQYNELARRHFEDHMKDLPQELLMPWQAEKGLENLVYEDLNNEQWAYLLNEFEDIQEAREKLKEAQLRRAEDYEIVDERVSETLETQYHVDMEEVALGVLRGVTSLDVYQEQAKHYRAIRNGNYQALALARELWGELFDEDAWESYQKWKEENTKPEDVAYQEYMDIRSDPPKQGGEPDWDKWTKQLDEYMATQSTETQAYILRRLDDWINTLPESIQKVERLLLDAKSALDVYFDTEEGDARELFLRENPEVNARMIILYGQNPRTLEAWDMAVDLLSQSGMSMTVIDRFNEDPSQYLRAYMTAQSAAKMDEYYALPAGKARVDFRTRNPELDATLKYLGRLEILRSSEAWKLYQIMEGASVVEIEKLFTAHIPEEKVELPPQVPQEPVPQVPTPGVKVEPSPVRPLEDLLQEFNLAQGHDSKVVYLDLMVDQYGAEAAERYLRPEDKVRYKWDIKSKEWDNYGLLPGLIAEGDNFSEVVEFWDKEYPNERTQSLIRRFPELKMIIEHLLSVYRTAEDPEEEVWRALLRMALTQGDADTIIKTIERIGKPYGWSRIKKEIIYATQEIEVEEKRPKIP